MDAVIEDTKTHDAPLEGARADISLLEEFEPGFFAERDAPLVSMYLTTQQGWPEAQQNRIRFKNLRADVEKAIERCYDKREFRGMLDALAIIEEQFEQDDAGMLGPLRQGLAVLANKGAVSVYRLDYPVETFALVADGYHIKPLVKNFQYGSHYYVMALSYDGFDVYRGDFSTLEELDHPDGIVTRFAELFDDYDVSLSEIGNRYKGGSRSYFGYDEKSQVIEKETVEHFRYAAEVMKDFMAGRRCPLVLAGLPRHQEVFRSLAHIPCLLERGIEKTFGSMDKKEQLAAVGAIIDELQREQIERLVARFCDAQAAGKASSDVNDITLALVERKVETLLVQKDGVIDGDVDVESGFLRRHGEACVRSDDLTDDFAQATYLQGGDVYVLEKDQMPGDTGVAALYRY